VLFHAVVDLATVPSTHTVSVFDRARERIATSMGSDGSGPIAEQVHQAWIKIGGTSGPLRPELVAAFAGGGGKQLKAELASVSQAARLRNGLQHLDFALAVLGAAGTFGALSAAAQTAVRTGILPAFAAAANLTFAQRTESATVHADLRYADASPPSV
jgi:hypothetical protein